MKQKGDDEICFKLVCSTKESLSGNELLKPIQLKTNYCVSLEAKGDGVETQQFSCSQCNPLAFPKCDQGRCVCPSPYKGTYCEECEPGHL